MGTEFVEGWRIAQTLGEGTFGEYVQIILTISNLSITILLTSSWA